jgi:hypothetical protein
MGLRTRTESAATALDRWRPYYEASLERLPHIRQVSLKECS